MESKYLFVGEDVSNLKIFEIINKYFGKSYGGWMKAWYDINDEFGAWFPTITPNDSRPNGDFGGTKNCSNTLSDDNKCIIEIDHDDANNTINDDPKYDKYRFVFARINGRFVFLGIFKRTIIKEDGRTIKKHEQIADGINLKSFEMYKKVF